MEKESRWSKISASFHGIFKLLFLLLIAYFGNKYFEITLSKNVTTINNNNVIPINEGHAIVSRPFPDASQACWFYHDTYRNLHPYVFFWEPEKDKKSGEERKPEYPKLRVVADPAIWKAKMCNKKGLEMHLFGDEEITHTIDAQFEKDGDFVRIAKSIANYHSILIFDNSGRIVARKIVADKYECSFLFPYQVQNKDFKLDEKVCKTEMSLPHSDSRTQGSEKKKEEQETKERINSLVITPNEKNFRNEANYDAALNLYVAKRMKLHRKLTTDGCGVITLETVLEKNDETIKPAIVFLCFKNSPESHVRVMVRE